MPVMGYRRRVWTRQPPSSARLAPGLDQYGVRFLWTATRGGRAHNDRPFKTYGSPVVTGPMGVGLNFNGSQTGTTTTLGDYSLNGAKYLWVLVAIDRYGPVNAGTQQRLLSRWGSGNQFFLQYYDFARFGLAIAGSSGNIEAYHTTATTAIQGRQVVLALFDATKAGANRFTFWVDGVKHATTAWVSSGADAALGNSTSDIAFGVDNNGGAPCPDTRMHLAAFGTGLVDDAFGVPVTRNPWQLFAPAVEPVFYSLGGGPPPSFKSAWARNANVIIQPGRI